MKSLRESSESCYKHRCCIMLPRIALMQLLISSVSGLLVTSPWIEPVTCGAWMEQDRYVCDPDNTLTDQERWVLGEVAGGCMAGSGLPQLSITVFIAQSLIFQAPPPKKVSNSEDDRRQNGTTVEPRGTGKVQDIGRKLQDGTGKVQDGAGIQDGSRRVQDDTGRVQDGTGRVQDGTGKENGTEEELRDEGTDLRRLQDMVLSSYNLTATRYILVIATHTPFQVSVWASVGVGLGENDTFIAQEIARTSFTAHHHLFTAIINALHSLCQKLRMQEAGYTTHWFVLTAIWVFFSFIFILGLTCTAVFLIRAKRRQNRRPSLEDLTRDSGDCPTRSSRPHQRRDLTPSDLTSVMYISSGHVLLSTTDVTAFAPSNCSSTDNLLDT